MFTDLAGRLADRYTVVSYDQRGHSRSPLDGEPQDLPPSVHADDAAALLRAVGDEPAYVYGSSGGGTIGLELVARHPELVRRLVAHEAARGASSRCRALARRVRRHRRDLPDRGRLPRDGQARSRRRRRRRAEVQRGDGEGGADAGEPGDGRTDDGHLRPVPRARAAADRRTPTRHRRSSRRFLADRQRRRRDLGRAARAPPQSRSPSASGSRWRTSQAPTAVGARIRRSLPTVWTISFGRNPPRMSKTGGSLRPPRTSNRNEGDRR